MALRFLTASVFALLLGISPTADAFFPRGVPSPTPFFEGNPNSAITAFNTTGVAFLTLTNGGSGGTGALAIKTQTITAGGVGGAIGPQAQGTGTTASGVFTNVSLTGGTGTGAVADITISYTHGAITSGDHGVAGTYRNFALTGGTGTGLRAVSLVVAFVHGTITGGSGGTPGTYNNVSLTGGTGTGLVANIVVGAGGGVTSVTFVANSASGYSNNDVVSANSVNIGGTTGFSTPLTTAGGVTVVNLDAGTGAASGYSTNDVISATPANIGGTTGFSTPLTVAGAVTNVGYQTTASRGAGYVVNDLLSAASGNIGGNTGFQVKVTALGAWFRNVNLTNISGTGTGAKASIRVNASGVAFYVELETLPNGTGYHVGDVLSVNPADAGGLTGLQLTVGSVGIQFERLSGTFPAFVQVSAAGIGATGTNHPYIDLEYCWDFGDPTGTETFFSPYTKTTVNANNSQCGPEAVYVYRDHGTGSYQAQITLTIRGRTAGGSYIIAQQTGVFSANANAHSGGEWFFDSNGPAGAGTSTSNSSNSIATLKAKLATGNALVHIKRASTFVTVGNERLGLGNGLRVDDKDGTNATWGTGAKPSISQNSSSIFPLLFTQANDFVGTGDIVITDLIVRGGGAGGAGLVNFDQLVNTVTSVSSAKNIYLDNVDGITDVAGNRPFTYGFAVPIVSGSLSLDPPISEGGGLWNCSGTTTLVGFSSDMEVFGGPAYWAFIYGGTWSGTGGDPNHDHIFYLDHVLHGAYRYIQPGAVNATRYFNYNMNLSGYDPFTAGCNLSGYPVNFKANYLDFAENDVHGTTSGWDGSSGCDTAYLWQYDNYVFERNMIHDMSSVTIMNNGELVVFRDNLIWNMSSVNYSPAPISTALELQVYRDKLWSLSPILSGFQFAGHTGALIYTDNIDQINATTNILQIFSSDIFPAGSIIDRNQYWMNAGDGITFMKDAGVAKTMNRSSSTPATGTWPSINVGGVSPDVHSTNADPKWCSPSTGNFNVCP